MHLKVLLDHFLVIDDFVKNLSFVVILQQLFKFGYRATQFLIECPHIFTNLLNGFLIGTCLVDHGLLATCGAFDIVKYHVEENFTRQHFFSQFLIRVF